MSEHDQRDDAELVAPEENPHAPAVADEVLPDTLHLMPIPNRPFFPGQVQPVAINPKEWGSTLKALGEVGNGLLGLSYVENAAISQRLAVSCVSIGCPCRPMAPASFWPRASSVFALFAG